MSDEYMFNGKTGFMSAENEAQLNRVLYKDLCRQFGTDLNEKQQSRMFKAVRHYMGEAQQRAGNKTLAEKNSRVLITAKQDMMAYMNRMSSAPPVEEQDVSRMDVASRFNQLQNERNGNKSQPPPPPNFRLEFKDDGPSALSQFEMAKKIRDEETARGEQLISQSMRADAEFSSAIRQASQQDQLVLQDRERSRLAAQREAQSEMASRLVTPDPRRMFMKDILDGNNMAQGQGTSIETLLNSQSGLADANPTIAYPSAIRTKPPQQADTIIRQDDILSYKENEYNLFVYSADRDWLLNKSQNRYNFTVNFDPANNGPGQTFAPSTTIRFKNITRIELVKTILPIEGVEILQTVDISGASPTYGTALNINALSFPYLNVYIPELDTNNFGTDYYFNQAFASIQYDANWVTDSAAASKGGYLAMIPKFLKCQKVYQPTPLATLRKLSISIQRPDGCLVSNTLDTLDIQNIISSYAFTAAGATTTGTKYGPTTGQTYLWLQTSTWFSRFMVNQGDRIQIKGLTFPSSYAGDSGARDDLINFLQNSEGLVVVGIARNTPAGTFLDGPNSVGYANCIIVRSKMVDPTTGSTAVSTFGNLAAAANQTFLNTLYTSTTLTNGRLINLSHQTTLVFRVITRDLDATTRLRPDNM